MSVRGTCVPHGATKHIQSMKVKADFVPSFQPDYKYEMKKQIATRCPRKRQKNLPRDWLSPRNMTITADARSAYLTIGWTIFCTSSAASSALTRRKDRRCTKKDVIAHLARLCSVTVT
jgi:hypothetical protein